MNITLPNYTVRALINFLANQGINRNRLLNQIRSTEVALNSIEQHYSADCYEKLLAYGSEQLNVKNIGFKHGKSFELSFWGILGHIVAASPTLLEALNYQKRYQCLLGNAGSAYHEVVEDNVLIRWLSEPNTSVNRIEQVVTAWVAFAFTYTQTKDKPVSIHFTHSCLTCVSEYEQFFGCKVYFNDNFNGVLVKKSSLNLPLTGFNEEVLHVLCCHAENKLAEKRLTASLDMVVEYVTDSLPSGVPTLEQVAEYLGISSRQLQRKLQQENTSLTQLIEHLRKQLAVAYLTQTDHKLMYITQMLGYSEQSAFQRAFKRWSGITPQEYRLKPMPFIE